MSLSHYDNFQVENAHATQINPFTELKHSNTLCLLLRLYVYWLFGIGNFRFDVNSMRNLKGGEGGEVEKRWGMNEHERIQYHLILSHVKNYKLFKRTGSYSPQYNTYGYNRWYGKIFASWDNCRYNKFCFAFMETNKNNAALKKKNTVMKEKNTVLKGKLWWKRKTLF